MDDQSDLDLRVGMLGELEVELQLARRGWHPLRLDSAQMAINADLIAVNRKKRVSLQVKTTNAERRHSHSSSLGFGYATSYLTMGDSIFNGKASPLEADLVVGVSYNGRDTRFVVMPVAFAETLCRRHVDYWMAVPKKDGEVRSPSFTIYLAFTEAGTQHVQHKEMCMRNLAAFENAWWVLNEPVDKLHDKQAWPLIA